MKRTLLAIAASVAIVGALETPAHSATALWKQTELWTITGHTDNSVCIASSRYTDGVMLLIVHNGTGWALGIEGNDINATPGEAFQVAMAFDKGEPFALPMTGIDIGQVQTPELNDKFAATFATSGTIHIKGIGSYDLTGSAEAIKETIACQSALSERRLSQAWEPKPTDQGV